MSSKIEDEELEFTCELQETLLNDVGKHFLRLVLVSQSGRDKLSDVAVRVGDKGSSIVKTTVITEPVEVGKDGTAIKFKRSKFTFTLPKGEFVERMFS